MLRLLTSCSSSKRLVTQVSLRSYSGRTAAAGSEYFKELIKNQNDNTSPEANVVNIKTDHEHDKSAAKRVVNIKTDHGKSAERVGFASSDKPKQSVVNDPKVYAQRLVYFNEYAKKKRKEAAAVASKERKSEQPSVDEALFKKNDTKLINGDDDMDQSSQFEYYNYRDQSTARKHVDDAEEAIMTNSSPRDWTQEVKSTRRETEEGTVETKHRVKAARSSGERSYEKMARDSSYREFSGRKNDIKQVPMNTTVESSLEIVGKSMSEIELKEEPLELFEDENLTEEEKLEKRIRSLRPATRPLVYNLAYFANTSPLVQKLVEMGVAIREWDKDPSIGSFILKLDFDKHVKPYLIFFHDIGLPAETHAFVITKSPSIFKSSLESLRTRIDYMKSKKFTAESIVEIVTRAPRWLSLTVEELDTKLGWFQKEFQLSGAEVRELVMSQPKLITLPLKIPSDVKFVLKELLVFDQAQIKSFLKQYPKLFIKDAKKVEANFIFLSQVAKLSHEEIASCPQVLTESLLVVKSRYAFLKHLARLQFDPTKPNFVSLICLTRARTDDDFCKHVAKSTVDEYKSFLKTV